MVDWRTVGGSALWILGLSIVVAVCGYADWLAAVSHRSRRGLFTDPWIRLLCSIALSAIVVGWICSQADRWWERAIGAALAGTCAWDVTRLLQARRRIDRD